jgi:hypothetical protein
LSSLRSNSGARAVSRSFASVLPSVTGARPPHRKARQPQRSHSRSSLPSAPGGAPAVENCTEAYSDAGKPANGCDAGYSLSGRPIHMARTSPATRARAVGRAERAAPVCSPEAASCAQAAAIEGYGCRRQCSSVNHWLTARPAAARQPRHAPVPKGGGGVAVVLASDAARSISTGESV